jgi:RNA polymerase sigma-70 factor (ECF subfamily)
MFNTVEAQQAWYGRESSALTAPGPVASVAIIRDMPLLSDEELVASYRSASDAGEREQYLNELFRRNYTRVARWCLRFTPDRETAADMAQEIFTRAYQNIHSFQGDSKFSTWLFVIARNHCLNVARANTRQATEQKTEVEDDFLSEIPDPSAGPDAGLHQQASANLARELLMALDERERAVFTLHYAEELPLDTITRMLALDNASGAKAYIVSAKRKLSRLVQRRDIQRPYRD